MWYEFFPRPCAAEPGRHGTFADARAQLRHAARMDFDVVYLPPSTRSGRHIARARTTRPSRYPEIRGVLGRSAPPTAATARSTRNSARSPTSTPSWRKRALGLEITLDIAFQCSPDHPWGREHPESFRHRPDGSIQYAENPPKKYQDVYPLELACEDWRGLRQALLEVFRFWIRHDITIFRVDDPHTKPFAFWEWAIAELRAERLECIFLAEAFTRPRVVEHLVEVGFSQSSSYFTWRNTKNELVVVNLSPHHPVAGWLELSLETIGLDPDWAFQMHDLLGGATFLWQTPRNYVVLGPAQSPAHVFRVRRRLRSERDFDDYS